MHITPVRARDSGIGETSLGGEFGCGGTFVKSEIFFLVIEIEVFNDRPMQRAHFEKSLADRPTALVSN